MWYDGLCIHYHGFDTFLPTHSAIPKDRVTYSWLIIIEIQLCRTSVPIAALRGRPGHLVDIGDLRIEWVWSRLAGWKGHQRMRGSHEGTLEGLCCTYWTGNGTSRMMHLSPSFRGGLGPGSIRGGDGWWACEGNPRSSGQL